MQFFKAAAEIWKPGITAGTFSDDMHVFKTNFVLVTAIDKAFHKSAGECKHLTIPTTKLHVVHHAPPIQ